MYVRINKKARKPVNSNWARIERYKDLKNAFSLMEMMVVLLIVAILAAATAPMVTKKMARNAGTGDSPWVFTGLNSSIAYNLNGNDNAPVIIGANSTPASLTAPTRLFIDSGNTASHIAFGNGNATPLGITADPANGRIGISNKTIPNKSVAFGAGHDYNNANPEFITAIGYGVYAHNRGVTAIGNGACAFGEDSIAIGAQNPHNHEGAYGANSITIGTSSYTERMNSIAIGNSATTLGEASIAIGNSATINEAGMFSIAIGSGARANARNSVAIGSGVTADQNDQIVLGGNATTVYIPGNLIVGNIAAIGTRRAGSAALWTSMAGSGWGYIGTSSPRAGESRNHLFMWNQNGDNFSNRTVISDRRLKNVGEAYTAGLDELKKLDFFHYTFKKDEAKTPHVGVMAQDLQKVFPDAVTKGEDGYLRIRMEDMFYAVINAVKELDTKITEIVENVTSLSKKVDEQQQVIDAQQKLIEELQAQNAEFEKRLTKIEKKAK